LTYSVRVSNKFERDLRKLGRNDQDRVWKVLEEIQKEPYSYKPLGGQLSGMRSARVGDLRVLFTVEENEKRIVLLYVGHRERVYER
jgi:mRNA interferase RelE/StbE